CPRQQHRSISIVGCLDASLDSGGISTMKSITGEGSELPALEPWKDDPETEADRHLAARLNIEFNGSEYEASVRFSRDMVHARRMLLEACAISRRLSEEIVTLRAALSSTQQESSEDAWRRGIKTAASLAVQYWESSFGKEIEKLLRNPYVAP